MSGKFINNSRGMMAADFIFSLTLCVGLCIVLFALTFTLSMSEVGQYIAFSTARAHAAAHVDPDQQMAQGMAKYKELLKNPVLKEVFANPNGGWFTLGQPTIKNGLNGSEFTEYKVDLKEIPLTGVRLTFQPKLLNMKIAFLGSTAEDSEAGYQANLTAFIFREPSQAECMDQVKARNSAILNLSTRYQTLGLATSAKYIPLEDNGC
ncbi:MAG TPA: hypothetical protein VN132_02320 [Bdellovibrio sp.]|nr:hypothetical protein [Bdellovibrio sp.]